ncbi:type-X family DNA polymerase [bacterium]|nr:type-X family DNA polymerase [bacterium]
MINTYLSKGGKTVEIPTQSSSRKEILDYIEICIEGSKRDELEGIWDLYSEKKKLIVPYLETLRDHYYSAGERGKVYGYDRAIATIKRVKVPILSGKQATNYKGIGPKIGEKIDEILETNKLKKVDKLVVKNEEKEKIIKLFTGIWGIGPAKAESLYNKGFRTIKDLQSDKNAQMKLLTLNERVGLQFYYSLKKKIPREDIASIEPILRKLALEVDPQMKFCICGSYRRQAATSGDIDILISSNLETKNTSDRGSENTSRNKPDVLGQFIGKLNREDIVIRTLALGKKKFMGIAKIKGVPRRLDVRFISPESWIPAVLYFTGSKEFNIYIRKEAIVKGYKLNEYHLKKGNKIIEIKTEKDIFKILNIPYFLPRYR